MSIRSLLSKSLFLLLYLSAIYSLGQVVQPSRFELLASDVNYDVVSANKKGLFLIIRNDKLTQNNTSWNVTKLDTLLNVEWVKDFHVPSKQSELGKYFDNEKLYFLFAKNDPNDKNLELYSLSVATGELETRLIRNYIPLALFDFKIIDNAAIVVGYYSYRPLVLHFDFDTHVPSILPGLFMDDASINQLKINDNQTFDVLIRARNFQNQSTMYLFTYSFRGELISQVVLNAERKKALLFGTSTPLSQHAQIVTGVYGNNYSEYSKGIFLANVNEYGEQRLRYINYADLSNFFNYLKTNKEERIRRRIKRRKDKEKPVKFNYRLLVHDIIDDNGNYILLGEAFYPKYKEVQGEYSGIFAPIWTVNRGLFKTNYIFDGYQYTHAVLLGFNQNGDLLWDNSFEINDVRSFELEQFVHAAKIGDRLVLMYVFNDEIRSKIINGSAVVEDKELTPIQLKFNEDKLEERSTEILGLNGWYDNVFYTYGLQTIKNLKTADVELKRDVFFINKVLYK